MVGYKALNTLSKAWKTVLMISYFHSGQTGFPATPPVTHKRRINRPEEYCGISNTNPNFLPISIELYTMNV